MKSINKTARIAGVLYLILVIFGILNLLYIPSKLIVWDDATQTLQNIIDSEMLFKLGVVCGVITFLSFIALVLVLYKLLYKVNKNHAIFMAVFALVSVPISFVNILSKFSVLTLIKNTGLVDGGVELENEVMYQLHMYDNGVELSQIFWGLWLLPFGYLVFKSGFLPKILGIFLMLGCFGYLVTFFGNFLYPDFYKTTFATIVGLPASIGELGICLWLIIMGARPLKFKKMQL